MEEKQYDVQAIKDRLNEYREAEREIENQTEMLRRLINKMESVGAQELSDMPRSGSTQDRVGAMVARKEELEAEISADIASQKEEWQRIDSILQQVKSADERAVVRFRYLLGMEWDAVSDALFGGRTDYLRKEDSFRRRTFRLHGQALLHMAMSVANVDSKIFLH